MTALRQKMIEDMQLHSFAERTQYSYLRAVRQLAAYFNKPPDQINEEELRQYWATHRDPVWIFPSSHQTVKGPMDASGVQRAFHGALLDSGIQKHACTQVSTRLMPGNIHPNAFFAESPACAGRLFGCTINTNPPI